ncbi:uncharacterized protein LOC125690850 [Lagopus muta]|uniref:uncharacterized protein LOC125690850 n=1 Tax=Lagopus muta TaxID=64668 RepID=UPI00209D3FA9|nr:uncharacterized protein LOC125690850 [Lagopus muta]
MVGVRRGSVGALSAVLTVPAAGAETATAAAAAAATTPRAPPAAAPPRAIYGAGPAQPLPPQRSPPSPWASALPPALGGGSRSSPAGGRGPEFSPIIPAPGQLPLSAR